MAESLFESICRQGVLLQCATEVFQLEQGSQQSPEASDFDWCTQLKHLQRWTNCSFWRCTSDRSPLRSSHAVIHCMRQGLDPIAAQYQAWLVVGPWRLPLGRFWCPSSGFHPSCPCVILNTFSICCGHKPARMIPHCFPQQKQRNGWGVLPHRVWESRRRVCRSWLKRGILENVGHDQQSDNRCCSWFVDPGLFPVWLSAIVD